MHITELQKRYARHPKVKALGKLMADSKERVIHVTGLHASATAMTFAALPVAAPEAVASPLLFVADDEEQAGYLYQDLRQMLGDTGVQFFPSSFKRAIKYGQRDAASKVLRTEVLGKVATGTLPLYVVTYPQALVETVVTREELTTNTLTLHRGEMVDITFVQDTLMELGFQRQDYVYEPGQYAVRGSIIDVFSFSGDMPIRIDFFGDEVDSIRTFEVDTQLSRERLEVATIIPDIDTAEERRQDVISFFPENTVVVARDLTFVEETLQCIYEEGFLDKALLTTTDDEGAPLNREHWLAEPATIMNHLRALRAVMVTSVDSPMERSHAAVRFDTHTQPIFHKNFDLVFSTFRRYQEEDYTIYILADSLKQTDRLESIFHDQQADIHFTAVERTLHEGFADADRKICVFTDHQIFDRFHKYNLRSDRARSGKVALTLKELQQFELGDYVVHIDHGVGQFGGLVHIVRGGMEQEMIKINYAGSASVYVSIHALYKVSKYHGKEGHPPRVNKLGGGAWERMKEKTKTKIKDIARDLIKLYSRRREEKGFAFSPDTYMQHALEASFLYEDTPDQLKATNDVKADMEKVRPMDRLVCGDVGFGKTEVAIRAACKACADGKQVAVLVPTTVLAYQHFRTFSERLKDLPIEVDYLSRARKADKVREITERLKNGQINVIIGTHRLISKTLRFHDLGLLIIDEEQKFGVSTKEKLRQMKTNVDTLTLTATPIPRTLQFSLMGARDLSVIQTPPPNRYPIQTQLCAFSSEVIGEAVNFEMSRNGQTFIVCNRISNLSEVEGVVRRAVPDARVAIGHGQMPSDVLEEIVLGFINHDYDVLISTTIIESGVDIPNANTIVICNAHHFGLSDLHQMRGRVGRGNKKAFCYLLSPPLSVLPPDARRRLQAIENFSDLGSGIHVAMQDLDIRGAGNLLGAEQSGFIADMGYETYQRILSEAVKELRNDEFQELYAQQVAEGTITEGSDFVSDCQVESDLQMYFPDEYVPTSSERMLLYRELDNLERDEDIAAFRHRMQDRFGPIPAVGEELINVVILRRLGKYFGAERIMLRQKTMRLYFMDDQSSPFFQSKAFGQVIAFAGTNVHRCRLEAHKGHNTLLFNDVPNVATAIELLGLMKKCH
ncbi:MAG: transcription-repair coupling factor [Bacteroidaceae bacterium]|nr:transcription-repair coupling factor [Bacteroidaceae bacterium]